MKFKDFWNKKSVVKEFTGYKAPVYWKKFLNSLRNPSSKNVLDAGCGAGRNSVLAARLGFNIYACDLHMGMVEETRKALRKDLGVQVRSRVMRADITSLPYAANSFHIVIASGVLHNTDRYRKLLRGIKSVSRVLKEGGFLCLNIFYHCKKSEYLKSSGKYKHVFYTQIGLPMVLLPKAKMLRVLSSSQLFPYRYFKTYTSEVSTGKRCVFRGVFVKKQERVKRSI